MTSSRRLIVSSIVFTIVVALILGTYWRIRRSDDTAPGGAGAAVPASATSAAGTFATNLAIPVGGAAARRGILVISVSAAAQAAAEKEARVTARVQGRVTRIGVWENQPVVGGALLLSIDSTEYALAVDRARAALTRAEASFQELTLFDDQIADPQVRLERDRVARAKSGLDEAKVELRQRELELARTEIRAPFAGRVASIRVVQGQIVQASDELLTVVDIHPIDVDVQVLESEVGYLAPGRGATVSFAAFPGEQFSGTIATINPVVEEDTRTARVTVRVPNRDGRVLPGMYARVSMEAREFPDRLLVPRSAILERDRRTMLFVYEGEGQTGLAKWRYVRTGLMNDSLVELIADPDVDRVEPGEIVLTDGHYTLIHDATVRLVSNVQSEGGRPE